MFIQSAAMSDPSKQDLVTRAKLAEQVERYDDMAQIMKAVAMSDEDMSEDDRNLLSVAYKNVVGARRSSWRVVSSNQQQKSDYKQSLVIEYKTTIEKELKDICREVLVRIIGDVICQLLSLS